MATGILREMGKITNKSKKKSLFLSKELKLMHDIFQSVGVKQTA